MSVVRNRLTDARSTIAQKEQCRVATTTNITLSGFKTIDGVALSAQDVNLRVLVKSQTDGRGGRPAEAKGLNQ